MCIFTALVCYRRLSRYRRIRAIIDHGLKYLKIFSCGLRRQRGRVLHNPSLTTIRQPLHQMGRSGRAYTVRDRAEQEFPLVVPIVPELVIRESTAPRSTAYALKRLEGEVPGAGGETGAFWRQPVTM